jgi:hypothetical protein
MAVTVITDVEEHIDPDLLVLWSDVSTDHEPETRKTRARWLLKLGALAVSPGAGDYMVRELLRRFIELDPYVRHIWQTLHELAALDVETDLEEASA